MSSLSSAVSEGKRYLPLEPLELSTVLPTRELLSSSQPDNRSYGAEYATPDERNDVLCPASADLTLAIFAASIVEQVSILTAASVVGSSLAVTTGIINALLFTNREGASTNADG